MGALMHSVMDEERVWRLSASPLHRTGDRRPEPLLSRFVIDRRPGGSGTGAVGSHDVHDAFSGRNQEFLELLSAYRGSGGLARTHEVMGPLRNRNVSPTEELARWIVARQIISFDWQDQTWFPWFQFDRESGRPRQPVGDIVQVLCSFLDDWQIACWFVRPNTAVDGRKPVDELARQSVKVLAAAHACRGRHNNPEPSRCGV